MKKILLTGASGFIGFHLAYRLQQAGYSVLGIDNFNDYYSVRLKEKRSELLKEWGVEVIHGDLCNRPLLTEVFNRFQPTHVVHLAAQAGVRYSLTHPEKYIHSNIEAFFQLLEILKNAKTVPLLFASSSSVYGNLNHPPFKEVDNTDHPVSFYGATKKMNEVMAYSYHSLYGIAVTALRFFTVYGPWGRPDMAYYKFAHLITEGKEIDVYHGGELIRDFTYIDDIVEGILRALDLSAPYEIFNLGAKRPVPLLRFIQILEEALGKKAKLRFLPMQQGDVFTTSADISHAEKSLGYLPKVSLEEGLTRFAEWYKQHADKSYLN